VIAHTGAAILADLGRPELAMERLVEAETPPLEQAAMLIETGSEAQALRLLGQLMESPSTQYAALRMLVDFHLRRGALQRARMRSGGLEERSDLAYAAARIALYESRWQDASEQSEVALQLDASDIDATIVWAHATAHLGRPGRALEQIDEASRRSLLVGRFDQARLDVLVISGRAPRETVAQFVSLLESTQPTSMTMLASLALAYEKIGDRARARTSARSVLAGEPHSREMHALLGRLLHHDGEREASTRHLREYLALAPETVPTDWARQLLHE
jgi:predicted Zn-dependent protease